MELSRIKQIHFTGIKGVGLTSLALCAQDLGIKISGSDLDEEFVTDAILKKRQINWQSGFKPEHLPAQWRSDPQAKASSLLIYTAAHQGPKNTEVLAAQDLGIETLSHAQAVGLFMQAKIGISICGVGGKTTTSAMVASILDQAGLNPSFAVGVGNINSLKTPGRYHKFGKHFVAEADEYYASPGVDNTPKFLYQRPEVIGVTNIAFDHPDVYKNFKQTKKAYLQFFKQLPAQGMLVACADNPNTIKVATKSKKPLLTYGFHPQADFHLSAYKTHPGQQQFTLTYQGFDINYQLQIPGRFNALNSACAAAIATHLGINPKITLKALAEFSGTMRRFEILGETHGLTLVDDYAHHPDEIRATLKAAKDWFPKRRLIAIFQPHTYSRTKALFSEFAQSFADCDLAIILPIYASAREKPDPTISSKKLVEEIKKYHSQVLLQESEGRLIKYLRSATKGGEVIFTLGAGDIFLLGRKLLRRL